jgi:outer membrane protein OmpA-like peptidoglycan-associated protein
MKAPSHRASIVVLLASAVTLGLPSLAEAADSDRGAAYVEAHLVGGTVAFGSSEGIPVSAGGFALEIHGGYHLSGRHDGFVIGLTQKLAIGTAVMGATVGRLGYDIAIPIGRRELTIAPYGFGGVAYGFSGGDPGAHFGLGVEGRFFPIQKWEKQSGTVVEAPRRVAVAADHIDIREKIQFKPNEAEIETASYSLLDEIAGVIKGNPQIKKLRIEGHASSDGDPGLNERLSESRARAVRAYLVDRGGVPADALEAKGFGARRSIASNDTEEGRDKNRRVEFNIVAQSETVERVERGRVRQRGGGEGLFIVAKPFELGFVTGTPFVTTVSFQAGLGYAF